MRHYTNQSKDKSIAVYPGSFDPITNGHWDIIERATYLFDEVHVLVAHNSSKKGAMFEPADRVNMIEAARRDGTKEHVFVHSMESTKATVDFCTELGARAMIRGLRTVTDFDAEFALAIANMGLAPHIETIFMVPQPQNHFISSSQVREIFKLRGAEGIKSLVPDAVYWQFKEREKGA